MYGRRGPVPARGTPVLGWCVEVSRASAVRGSRLSGWHVRAILLALLIALLTPAIATAQTEAPAAPEEAPPTLDVGPSGDEGTAPAAESPAPTDEAQPPAAEQPAAEPPAAEQPSSPAPPPAAEEPPLVELPDLVPPPAPVEPTPAPVAEGPAAAPAPTEATPTASGTVTPALPAAPDAPRAARSDVLLGPAIVDAGAGSAKPLTVLPAVKAMGGPTPPPTSVGLSSLGGPTAPPVVADLSATGPPGDASALPAPPGRPEFSTALLEPSVSTAAPTRRDAAGPPGPQSGASDDNPFATIAAVGGPVPVGSSLLAVLASYVIPGGGALPTTTLFLFVQLAVILAAFSAPRLGRGELALALGRLGPRSGYRTVLARPG